MKTKPNILLILNDLAETRPENVREPDGLWRARSGRVGVKDRDWLNEHRKARRARSAL